MTNEDTSVPEGTASAATPATGRSWGRRDKQVGALLGVALAAGAVLLASQASDYRSNSQRDDDRVAVVDAAERVAVGLVTLRPKSAAEDIEALAALGTGDFASDLRANLDARVEIFQENKISSSGEVTGAGVVSLDDDKASVAVAIKSVVKAATANKSEDRFYRMTLTLERSASGEWLVSEAEFVQ